MGSTPRGSASTTSAQASSSKLSQNRVDTQHQLPMTPLPPSSDATKNSTSEPNSTLPKFSDSQVNFVRLQRTTSPPNPPLSQFSHQEKNLSNNTSLVKNRLTENVTTKKSSTSIPNHIQTFTPEHPDTQNPPPDPQPHYTYTDIIGDTPMSGYTYNPQDPNPPIALRTSNWLPSTHAGQPHLLRG